MKIEKNCFRIGTLAQELGLEKFVVRFWEKEFNIKSTRSSGGQRYYTAADLEMFKQIKELLYAKKFTIAGAKDALMQSSHKVIGSKKTTMQPDTVTLSRNHLYTLRKSLITLKKFL